MNQQKETNMTTYAPTPTQTDDESIDSLTALGGFGGPRVYFGEITIVDDFDCILERGRGKVPFDAGVHRPDQRLVALKLNITCTKADGTSYDLIQDDITSGSKHKVTLKSLQDLGITTRAQLRGLVGRFCQVSRVDTGRKYTATKGVNAGETIAETALKFLALYDNEEACKAAEVAFYAPKSNGNSNGAASQRNVPQAVPNEAPQVARAALVATLPALWTASGQDMAVFERILNSNPGYAQNKIDIWCEEATALHGQVPF